MAKLGNRIIILANGQPIAGTKVNEIETAIEVMERCSPTSGQWKKYVTKRKSWKFSSGYLVVNESSVGAGTSGLQDLLRVGQDYTIIVHDRQSQNDAGVYGTATLTRCKIVTSISKLVEGSFEFVGNGPLAPAVLVESITLSHTSISMSQGSSMTNPVSATVAPNNATNKKLSWSSSDASVARVTQNGDDYTIVAVDAGVCNLVAMATDGSGVLSSCSVIVGLE